MPRGIDPGEVFSSDFENLPEKRLEKLKSKEDELQGKMVTLKERVTKLKSSRQQGNNVFSSLAFKIKSFFNEMIPRLLLASTTSAKAQIRCKIDKLTKQIQKRDNDFQQKIAARDARMEAFQLGNVVGEDFEDDDDILKDLEQSFKDLQKDFNQSYLSGQVGASSSPQDIVRKEFLSTSSEGSNAAETRDSSRTNSLYGGDHDMSITEDFVRSAPDKNRNHGGFTANQLTKMVDIKNKLLEKVKQNDGVIPRDINKTIETILKDPEIMDLFGKSLAVDVAEFFKQAFAASEHETYEDRLGAIESIMKLYLGIASDR